MYLPNVALHNLVCLAKKGMLLIQERFRFFGASGISGMEYWIGMVEWNTGMELQNGSFNNIA